jgi:hypothetical protein
VIVLFVVIALAVCRRKRANGAAGPVAAVGDVPMGTLPPSSSSSSIYRDLKLSERSSEAPLPSSASSIYRELQLSNSNSKQSSTVYAATGLHSSSAPPPYTAAPTQAATQAATQADLYVSGEVERVEVEVDEAEANTLPYLPFPKLDQEKE